MTSTQLLLSLDRPHVVKQLHKTVIDHESDGHVQTDSTQSRKSAFVESANVKQMSNVKQMLHENKVISVHCWKCHTTHVVHSTTWHVDIKYFSRELWNPRRSKFKILPWPVKNPSQLYSKNSKYPQCTHLQLIHFFVFINVWLID